MQIVIDLEDECIKKIEKVRFLIGGKEDIQLQNHVINAIKNGIPLPKGHGRLVDINAFTFEVKGGDTLLVDAPTILEADKEKEGE